MCRPKNRFDRTRLGCHLKIEITGNPTIDLHKQFFYWSVESLGIRN